MASRGELMLSRLGIRLQRDKNNSSKWKLLNSVVLNDQNEGVNDVLAVEHTKPVDIPAQIEHRDKNDFSSGKLLSIYSPSTSNDKFCQDNIILTAGSENPKEFVVNPEPPASSPESLEGNTQISSALPLSPSSSISIDDDNSVKDPNFTTSSSSSTSSASELDSEPENLNHDVEQENKKPRTRKRKADPLSWQRNESKLLRNSGKSYQNTKGVSVPNREMRPYQNTKGVSVPNREMRPPCGVKCRLQCANKFTEEARLNFFRKYWSLSDINMQRNFILHFMQEINPQYRYVLADRVRGQRVKNNAFYFENDGTKVRVCKLFFTATLGISFRCIRTVIEKSKEGFLTNSCRGKHNNHKHISDDIKNGVRAHISSIPQVDSHYTRAHTEKKFIEGGKTLVQLYRDYKYDCEQNKKPYANLTLYSKIFNYEFNLAFFSPKKDQCQLCVSYENSDNEGKKQLETKYAAHIKEKDLSRVEKEKDKKAINELNFLACFDLQAALPTPRGEVSCYYYKSKLSTYNFTVCDLASKGIRDVYSYMWHEGEGRKGATEIGSCLLDYLKEKAATSNSEDLEFTFFSDNCCGQQKNKFIVTAYLYAIANYKIKSVTHKFLVVGHTQNEGDSVHSVIEKNIKRSLKSGPIHVPSQYTTLVTTARKSGTPYKVIEKSHDNFYDLKDLTEQTAVNFSKNTTGDTIKFHDIAVIRVERDHLDYFFYKNSYEDEQYTSVNVKECKTRKPLLPFQNIELKQAYKDSIPISKAKYDGLQSLLNNKTIPQCHSYFYNCLKYD